MLRRASVVWGLAVLLSLLFPLGSLLTAGGIDPAAVRLPQIDLAAACALLAVLPAMALSRDAQIARRIPRWSAWIALLALCSLLFLLLHMEWSLALATTHAREALAQGGALAARITPHALLQGMDLAARIGVLVSVVGVLVNLEAVQEDAPVRRKRRRR